MTLEALFAGRNFDLKAAQERMSNLMADEGLPYGDRTKTFNSRLAQELAAWADTQAGGERIHDTLFRGYFVDGRNLADRRVLLESAESIGLSISDAEQVLDTRSHRAAVDADWAESRQLGITGVPMFVAGQRGVAGCQPYDVLEQLVLAAGAEKRTDQP